MDPEELERLRQQQALLGQEQAQPEQGVNATDVMLGGAGLGAVGFAAQTGRAPAPQMPLKPSAFAQQVALNDAARTTQSVLVGQGTTTSPVTQGRPVPGTTLSTTNPLATTGGGVPSPTPNTPYGSAPRGATPGPVIDAEFVNQNPVRTGAANVAKSILGGLTRGAIQGTVGPGGLVLAPTTMGDATISQVENRENAASMAGIQAEREAEAPLKVEYDKRVAAGEDPKFVEFDIYGSKGSPATQAFIQEGSAEGISDTMTDETLRAIGEIQSTPTLDVAKERLRISNEQEAAGQPSIDTYISPGREGTTYGGTIVGTTPGGAIEFAPEGENLIRTMDPTSGDVVFADPQTVARFADDFQAKRLADREAQQRAIQQISSSGIGYQLAEQEFAKRQAQSAAMQARMDSRPDFMEAVSDADRRAKATGGGAASMSDADRRKLAKGLMKGASTSEQADALKVQQQYGLGDFKPERTESEEAYLQRRTDLINAQINKLQSENPDKVAAAQAVVDKLPISDELKELALLDALGLGQTSAAMAGEIAARSFNTTPTPTQTITTDDDKVNAVLEKNPTFTRDDVIDELKQKGKIADTYTSVMIGGLM